MLFQCQFGLAEDAQHKSNKRESAHEDEKTLFDDAIHNFLPISHLVSNCDQLTQIDDSIAKMLKYIFFLLAS